MFMDTIRGWPIGEAAMVLATLESFGIKSAADLKAKLIKAERTELLRDIDGRLHPELADRIKRNLKEI